MTCKYVFEQPFTGIQKNARKICELAKLTGNMSPPHHAHASDQGAPHCVESNGIKREGVVKFPSYIVHNDKKSELHISLLSALFSPPSQMLIVKLVHAMCAATLRMESFEAMTGM